MTKDQLEKLGIRNEAWKVPHGMGLIYEVLVTSNAEQLTAVAPALVEIANMYAKVNGLRPLASVEPHEGRKPLTFTGD